MKPIIKEFEKFEDLGIREFQKLEDLEIRGIRWIWNSRICIDYNHSIANVDSLVQ